MSHETILILIKDVPSWHLVTWEIRIKKSVAYLEVEWWIQAGSPQARNRAYFDRKPLSY